MLQTGRLARGGTIPLKVIKYLKKGWVRGIWQLSLLFCTLCAGRAHYGIKQKKILTGPPCFLCSACMIYSIQWVIHIIHSRLELRVQVTKSRVLSHHTSFVIMLRSRAASTCFCLWFSWGFHFMKWLTQSICSICKLRFWQKKENSPVVLFKEMFPTMWSIFFALAPETQKSFSCLNLKSNLKEYQCSDRAQPCQH